MDWAYREIAIYERQISHTRLFLSISILLPFSTAVLLSYHPHLSYPTLRRARNACRDMLPTCRSSNETWVTLLKPSIVTDASTREIPRAAIPE